MAAVRLDGYTRTGVEGVGCEFVLDLDANMDWIIVFPLAESQTLQKIFYAPKQEELQELFAVEAYLLNGFSCYNSKKKIRGFKANSSRDSLSERLRIAMWNP